MAGVVAAEASMGRALARMTNIAEKLLPSFSICEYVSPGICIGDWMALGIDPSRSEEVGMQVEEGVEEAIQFVGSCI